MKDRSGRGAHLLTGRRGDYAHAYSELEKQDIIQTGPGLNDVVQMQAPVKGLHQALIHEAAKYYLYANWMLRASKTIQALKEVLNAGFNA